MRVFDAPEGQGSIARLGRPDGFGAPVTVIAARLKDLFRAHETEREQ